ncbi:carbohydrate ABC transporter permease [Kineococcus indalonis]|uniref:carbohydrate ABC transporter permease n=1 Tax=Kineococcus indalonis TaxID=2696566 RepID=UPI001412DAE2|nr:carbohydrate ABC transporter permease [Kineococcus indalonis]NAZ85859.1 ABC transporter permease subunit [Kineococcus indalonis]
MATTVSTSRKAPADAAGGGRVRRAGGSRNYLGGLFGWIWLAIIIIPIYWIVVTSFKEQSEYFGSNPLALPKAPTLSAYQQVIESNILRYFINSVIITVGSVVPAVLMSFMAAFAIVRGGGGRFLKAVNGVFLMGLAIPLQATIIPVYLIIIRLELYDTLAALILPSIAFAIPLTVLLLSNFIRDVPNELFESMRLDGSSEWGSMWRLAFPLTRPAIVTVSIYNALQVWNGFLLPLVLTQSPERRVMPLALWDFQGQYTINIPAVLAAVVLSTLPILVLYVVGRRQLIAGLTAGFSK